MTCLFCRNWRWAWNLVRWGQPIPEPPPHNCIFGDEVAGGAASGSREQAA